MSDYTPAELALVLGEDESYWTQHADWLSDVVGVQLSAEQLEALEYLRNYSGTNRLVASWRALTESPGWIPNEDQVAVALFTKQRQQDYSEYLSSETWRAYCARRIASNLPDWCPACGDRYRSDFHCHHVTYRRLGAERLNDTWLVCGPCHERIHALALQEGLSIDAATRRLRKEAERAGLLPTCQHPGCGSVKTLKRTGWSRCGQHRAGAG